MTPNEIVAAMTKDELPEKLINMMQAHVDGVYVFSARGNTDEMLSEIFKAVLTNGRLTSALVAEIRELRTEIKSALVALNSEVEYQHRETQFSPRGSSCRGSVMLPRDILEYLMVRTNWINEIKE